MTTSLIIRNDAQLAAAIPAEALALKEEALASGALIGRVTNAAENLDGVEAQKKMQAFLDAVEAVREELTAAPWKLFKAVNATAAELTKEVKDEIMRVSKLLGDFQALEQSKRRAAANAVNAELSEFERQKAEALAKATTHGERDAIMDHFGDLVAQTQMAVVQTEVPRVEGQRITQDWAITVTDVHTLYRFHPACVELKPKLSEIKALLNDPELQGPVRGITAERKIKATVRAPKSEAISV